ncbi:hypothetical protein ES702_00574 [subsurface metagenome]
MRQINVKKGSSRYKLKGDDGVYIGELTITYDKDEHTCGLFLTKLGVTMTNLSIEAKLKK